MYRTIGADHKEYGPAGIEELRAWIAAGRVNDQTLVRAEAGSEWKPLSAWPELAPLVVKIPPLVSPAPGPARLTNVPGTNGMATAGLVLGILSLLCCGPVFGLMGLVFSGVALSQISRNPGQESGKGLAVVGMIFSILGLGVGIIVLLVAFFLSMVHSIR